MLNLFLTSWGNEFQSLGAEQENVPLYSEVRANGVYKVPFFPDRRFNVCLGHRCKHFCYLVGCHIV